MSERSYVARKKQKLGPFSAAELKELARTLALLPTDMVLQEGTQKWQAASEIEGLFWATAEENTGEPVQAASLPFTLPAPEGAVARSLPVDTLHKPLAEESGAMSLAEESGVMNGDQALAAGEEQLRQEFETLVRSVVDQVHRTASSTVQQARGDLQKVIEDLGHALHALQHTASQARDAVNPISTLAQEVQAFHATFAQKTTDLSRRLEQVEGGLSTALQLLDTTGKQVQEMERDGRQRLLEAERRLKWFFILVGLVLIGTGTALWAVIGLVHFTRGLFQ